MHLDPPAPFTEDLGPVGRRVVTLDATCVASVEHAHKYHDHPTGVIDGELDLTLHPGTAQETTVRLVAGDWYVVPKAVPHTVTRVSPIVRYVCVFLHRDQAGVVVQEYVGNALESA